MATPIDLVDRSLGDETRREFAQRVDEQALQITDALRAGRFESPGFALGLELEAYAVDEEGRLARVPDRVFDEDCERELGLHNLEFNTAPTAFDEAGIEAQASQLGRRYRRAREAAADTGLEIVLDGMWTTPPPEGTQSYLGTTAEREGATLAENMTPSPRYYAIDNHVLSRTDGEISLSVPGVDRSFPTLLFESLTSSIQPHLQLPDVDAFPRYYNLAVRTLGPVLALATNSPFLPPDLYDLEESEFDDPLELLEATPHELRIPVFEQSINRAWEKVRVPRDLADATDAVDRLVADPTCAPFLREWVVGDEDGNGRDAFPGRFWELDHKRGTYWRWLRTVIGGQPVGTGDRWSVRLEYRPLPTQPTVDESVGFQCLVAGLLRGLVVTDHPLADLERDAAERSFYAVVENGLEADLAWLTVDGERTSDPTAIYDELFELARRGLREQGVGDETIDEYLAPLEARRREGTTPSRWKRRRVREHLEVGMEFADAVREMQREYVGRSGRGEPLTRWS